MSGMGSEAGPVEQRRGAFEPPPVAGFGHPGPERRTDLEHLRLLGIGFYVYAGISLLFGLLPIIHLTLGLAMISGKASFLFPAPGAGAAGPDAAFAWMFVVIGALGVAMGMTFAVLNLVVARKLGARHHRVFCIVVGAIDCINVPLGTLLGVFAILVLSRPSVRALFGEAPDVPR
jgi:hypothetical protein